MEFKLFAFAGILLLASGCGTINPHKITYNDEKAQYTYQHSQQEISLRNQQRQLIDSTNFEDFITEIELNRNKYPFEERQEKDQYLRNSDFTIARIYSDINVQIREKSYLKAQKGLAKLRRINPEIDLYSDSYFLEGYIFEKLGQTDLAADAYQNFYTYSSQKYSGKFRGHKHSDANNTMYLEERKYASNFVQQKPDSINENIIWPIQPKFHYSSFQPGFIHNQDEFQNKSNILTNISLGLSSDGNFAFGLMLTSCQKNSFTNVIVGGVKSNNATEFFAGIPIQIFKTESNNFGFKLSPYINFSMVDFNGHQDNILNFGNKASATYFLTQKFFLGSYYQVNLFNENNPYYLSTSGDRVWYPNEFDFSAYYTIIKDLSLKVGMKNKDLVAGFYLGNTEFSYNFSTSNAILRTDIF